MEILESTSVQPSPAEINERVIAIKSLRFLLIAASKRETEVGKGSGRNQEAKRGTRTGKSKIARRRRFVTVRTIPCSSLKMNC